MTLTIEQAEARLRVIKAIQKLIDERLEYSHTAAFDELSQIDQLAYVIVNKGIADALKELVDQLTKDMGITPKSKDDVAENLAQVIGLFDGNRRQRHP